jgi:hypothetical protein
VNLRQWLFLGFGLGGIAACVMASTYTGKAVLELVAGGVVVGVVGLMGALK